MSPEFSPYLLEFCRVVTGLLFLLSFKSKMSKPLAFWKAVTDFGILPKGLSKITGTIFLASELLVVIFLAMGGNWLIAGFIIAIILLFIFSSALLSALSRKLQVSCNCFGESEKPISAYEVWRNMGLIVCSFIGVLLAPTAAMITIPISAMLLIVAAGFIFVLSLLNIHELIQLFD